MHRLRPILLATCLLLGAISCKEVKSQGEKKSNELLSFKNLEMRNDTVYHSSDLIVIQRSKHVFQHISFLKTTDFGLVECNGMLVVKNKEAICFDTPAEEKSTEELLNWTMDSINAKILAVVPTHFHKDCVGGLDVFVAHIIPVIASDKTIVFLKEKSNPFYSKITGFKDSIRIPLADTSVIVQFLGAGHTVDNVVAYFAPDQALFGGCLIKELGASKGNLEDADTLAWPKTIARVKHTFPNVKVIIPGHGKPGDLGLLSYTETLFEVK